MVTIVGAGLAGSILSRLLTEHKIKHVVYDCEKPWRASPISENLFSTTWSKTLGDKVVNNGLKTLERIVDIDSFRFKTKGGYQPVLRVPPDRIQVKYVNREFDRFAETDYVVDCRGFWAQPIKRQVYGLTGQGLLISGKLKVEPIMNFVSPYVHQKLFQFDDKQIWYGDSTCIEHGKYLKKAREYEWRCEQRYTALTQHILTPKNHKIVHGIRPVVDGHKGFLTMSRHRIVNTGGWKCGLIIYADHAQKILTYLKRQ